MRSRPSRPPRSRRGRRSSRPAPWRAGRSRSPGPRWRARPRRASLTSRGCGRGSATPTPNDVAALGEDAERVLEGGEVARQQQVERAAVRPGRAQPGAQHAGVVLLGEREQDRELGPVVELAGDDGERVLVEDPQQLVVAEPEAGLQQGCGGAGQKSWFSPPKTSETESSVKMRRIESVRRSAQESTRMWS